MEAKYAEAIGRLRDNPYGERDTLRGDLMFRVDLELAWAGLFDATPISAPLLVAAGMGRQVDTKGDVGYHLMVGAVGDDDMSHPGTEVRLVDAGTGWLAEVRKTWDSWHAGVGLPTVPMKTMGEVRAMLFWLNVKPEREPK